MSKPSLVVTLASGARDRAAIAVAADGKAELVYLADLSPDERGEALRGAAALIARHTNELAPAELPLIANARLLQFMTAGIDYIPFGALPAGLPVAHNGGAYAEPMAEQAVAMALAAAKRLLVEHRNLARGEFNQFVPNRMLARGVCGIFGLGGAGAATARRMRGLGMRIHAINRSGASEEPVDWIATPDRLDDLLRASDVLVVSAALTRATRGILGREALAQMKDDAILVNVARGEIIDQDALWHHLRAHPRFTACIDAWWIEPLRHGRFHIDHPFLDLPNVIGSPHNSAIVPGNNATGLRQAVENCLRALRGETPLHLVRPDERLA